MKNGPKLTLRPKPVSASSDDALARLEILKEWTEEPARAAAEALEEEGNTAPAETKTQGAVAPSRPKPKDELVPTWLQAVEWDSSSDKSQQQLNIKVPAELYTKIKFLCALPGAPKIRDFVVECLERQVKKALAERNIK